MHLSFAQPNPLAKLAATPCEKLLIFAQIACSIPLVVLLGINCNSAGMQCGNSLLRAFAKTTLIVASSITGIIFLTIFLFFAGRLYDKFKPDHWIYSTTEFIRTNSHNYQYISLVPKLFEEGEARDAVYERLKSDGFRSAAGTPFASRLASGDEKWFRRDQFMALWHFDVLLRFDAEDRLVTAQGLVAGPTFE